MVKLASSNIIKYIKRNCKFLHQGRNNPDAPACAQGCLTRSSSKEKDLRVFVGNELTRSQRRSPLQKVTLCVLAERKVKSLLGCTRKSITRK